MKKVLSVFVPVLFALAAIAATLFAGIQAFSEEATTMSLSELNACRLNIDYRPGSEFKLLIGSEKYSVEEGMISFSLEGSEEDLAVTCRIVPKLTVATVDAEDDAYVNDDWDWVRSGEFELRPGKGHTVLFDFAPPEGAAPGVYEFYYGLEMDAFDGTRTVELDPFKVMVSYLIDPAFDHPVMPPDPAIANDPPATAY